MAQVQLTSGWRQALWLTSLLANGSNFAAVDKSTSIAPTLAMPTPALSSHNAHFSISPMADVGATLIPTIKDPNATKAQEVCPGYLATRVGLTDDGFTAHLSLLGEPCHAYGTDIPDLLLTVEHQSETRLHVNIKPSHITAHNESWYILPNELIPAPQPEGQIAESDLVFSWVNTPSFGFNVSRESTQEVLFSTTGHKLIYENQFIEFVTSMNEGYNLYGMGEVMHGVRLQPGLTRTIYAADAGDTIDDNIYGSHPFALETRYREIDQVAASRQSHYAKSSNASKQFESSSHGLYWRNAHALEILMGETNVTWRSLGGDIDLYFFAGPSQPEVTSQYLTQVGLPGLQQYWTFGYHQCRWGYENWSMTEEVVKNFAKFDIPLETIWNDIDYMKGYRDFDNDPERFSYAEGQEFLETLHRNGQHYVPIVDAAIYHPNPHNDSDVYHVFDDGNKTNSFLLNPDGSQCIGAVWPGYTVFPDWLTSSAPKWWRKTVGDWHKKIPFDGLWIDMNEVSSFCVGSCGSKNLSDNPVHPSFLLPGEPGNLIYDYPEGFELTNVSEAASASAGSASQYSATALPSSSATRSPLKTIPSLDKRDVNYPPYVINHVHGDLAVHAVSPNATHHNGVLEYDVHNLYGHQILRNTYAAIKEIYPDKRPFIIGRSTFVGSGNYSGHWGGDNYSKFLYMYLSIPQALSFSLFGIPMFGVDTCGFSGNTDEELCNRWMQLSAFFPFYRNHNVLGAIAQEPYVWDSVTKATKIAMGIRFQLLPYMYTLFFYAHTQGQTVMRALAWEFPNDPLLADADRQFFLGPAILVTPVLTQGHTTVNGVFPGLIEGTDIYYDWYNQSAVPLPLVKNTTIDAPLGHIPVHIRGGYILATQEMRLTTREARKTDWSLIVALDKDGRADGKLYLDDGESLEPETVKLVSMSAQVGYSSGGNGTTVARLRIDVFVDGIFDGLDLPLANVTVLGVQGEPDSREVKVLGDKIDVNAQYCNDRKRLSISGAHGSLIDKAWGKDWSLTL